MEAKAVGNEGKIYRLLPLTNTTITEIKGFRFRKKSLIHLKIDQENSKIEDSGEPTPKSTAR